MILLLDVLLLRIQSYRHLLFNYDITTKLLWRLVIVFVLCEAYTKLKRLGLESQNTIVLQVYFHSFFIQAILGKTWVACMFHIKGLTYAPFKRGQSLFFLSVLLVRHLLPTKKCNALLWAWGGEV